MNVQIDEVAFFVLHRVGSVVVSFDGGSLVFVGVVEMRSSKRSKDVVC